MNTLEGKVAVITGASSGIGLATAQRFVAEGAFVYITGRRQSALDAAVRQIGKHVTAVQGDVSNLADLDRLYAAVQQQHGRLDIVFANAGIGEFAPLGEISEAHFDNTFNVNVKGLLFTVQKALPLLQNGGSIILAASNTTTKVAPAFSVYSADAGPPSPPDPRQCHQPWLHQHPRTARPGADRGREQAALEGNGSQHPAGAAGRSGRNRQSGRVPRLGGQQLYYGDRTVRRWGPGPGLRHPGRRRLIEAPTTRMPFSLKLSSGGISAD